MIGEINVGERPMKKWMKVTKRYVGACGVDDDLVRIMEGER